MTGTPVLPEDPVKAIRAGQAARVPVLIGTNRDEFTLFVALQYLRLGREETPAQYPGLLTDTFGTDGAAVARHVGDGQDALGELRAVLAAVEAGAVAESALACEPSSGHAVHALTHGSAYNRPLERAAAATLEALA